MVDATKWEAHLDALEIQSERHRRIATEGALWGGLIECGFNTERVIVSDGTGQFAIRQHARCWVHAERLIHQTIPLNDQHREDIATVRNEMGTLYADLKRFQDHPVPALATPRRARLETIFTHQTRFQTLNQSTAQAFAPA
jgi:hypothetical protein